MRYLPIFAAGCFLALFICSTLNAQVDMSKRAKLTEAEISERLQALPKWALELNALERWYTFENFNQAWGFLSRVAMEQERLDHHAEIWNVYNRVKIRLNTHDAGGVTALDFELATAIELFSQGQARP